MARENFNTQTALVTTNFGKMVTVTIAKELLKLSQTTV